MSESESNESALEKWQRFKAEGRPVGEHILNIIKAGLSAAPFAGAIASLMTDYIPIARAQRLEQFAEQIADDLWRLQDRVRVEYLKTDDFAFMFEKCFRATSENPQREKLQAFRGILVNSAICNDLAEEEKEYFLNLAMNLSVLHIRLLRFMATPEEYLAATGVQPSSIHGGFSEFLPVAIPGIKLQVIHSAFGDLYRYGFLTTDQSSFTTTTLTQGLRLLSGIVTELGQNFISFCTVPK